MGQGRDLRQEFLDALAGRHHTAGSSPPAEEQPPVAPDIAEPVAEPPSPPSAAPLSFEQQPPPAEEVPPAMAALAADPEPPAAPPAAAGPDLMDLGADAQLQFTALRLHSIGQRLAVVSEGLKLIPILAVIADDLEHLKYPQVAQAVDALSEWVRGEEQALMQELDQRGAARRGDTPPQ